MRNNDVRYGKKRAHKKDMVRRHVESDLEWEAEENDPLPVVDLKPLRVKM